MFVHVSLFTALALMSWAAPVPGERLPEEKTLEVIVEAAPAPTPEPVVAAPTPTPERIQPEAARGVVTQLDPAHLKKADQAPEKAVAIAAHHSKATKAKPRPTSTPEPTPEPTPTPAVVQAIVTPLPTPVKAASPDEEVGIDALGNYGKAVGNAIGLRSEYYRQTQKEALAIGEVRIKFSIDAKGQVSDVQILSNTANSVNAVCAERAVREAKIPSIPPERLAQLPGGRIKIVYSFTIYPTQ